MTEVVADQPEVLEAEGIWESMLRLPIEARFAKRAGVKPISSFIWDHAPEYIEAEGSVVAVHQLGPKDGIPVLSFHGNPGSARGPHPAPALLEAEGIRLIASDTPGFGESPYILTDTPFATFGNIAKSVVKALGYEKVAVLARSGGVPRALGFAALHPECISSMILIAGPAPPTADIDWQAGMTTANQAIYTAIQETPHLVLKRFLRIAEELTEDEDYHIGSLWPDMSEYDKMIFELQPDVRISTAAGHAAGLSHGHIGWVQSAIALRRAWGFEVSDVKTPALILHGNDDPYASIEHSKWLQRNIDGAELVEMEGGHFANWLQIRRQLAYLREGYLQTERGVGTVGGQTVPTTIRLDGSFKLSGAN